MVLDDDLEFGPDHLYYWEGKPFSGVATGEDEEGTYEVQYVDGLEEGVSKQWYPDGALKQVTECRKGARHGEFRILSRNGSLLAHGRYEFGIKLAYEEFDSDGNTISHYKLATSDPMWEVLESFRRREGAKGGVGETN